MIKPALLVTVDVEEDMPHWKVEPDIRVSNVAALPRLQSLCDRLGVKPTYLITYPMATAPSSHRVLTDLLATERCELGTHLHVWNTPPLPDGPELEALRATEIPRALMIARLSTLTETIQERFGMRPTSYRSGRFGFDEAVLEALSALGYEVDSSVTSGLDWHGEGGVNFRTAPTHPYYPDPYNILQEGTSPVLEVPVSVGYSRPVPGWAGALYQRLPHWTHLRGLLSDDYSGLLDYHWLSPARRSLSSLIRVADSLLDQGASFINIFFHSSELFPGTSIYHKTEAQVDAYFRTLEGLLEHLVRERCVQSRTLTGFARDWRLVHALAPSSSPDAPHSSSSKESIA